MLPQEGRAGVAYGREEALVDEGALDVERRVVRRQVCLELVLEDDVHRVRPVEVERPEVEVLRLVQRLPVSQLHVRVLRDGGLVRRQEREQEVAVPVGPGAEQLHDHAVDVVLARDGQLRLDRLGEGVLGRLEGERPLVVVGEEPPEVELRVVERGLVPHRLQEDIASVSAWAGRTTHTPVEMIVHLGEGDGVLGLSARPRLVYSIVSRRASLRLG